MVVVYRTVVVRSGLVLSWVCQWLIGSRFDSSYLQTFSRESARVNLSGVRKRNKLNLSFLPEAITGLTKHSLEPIKPFSVTTNVWFKQLPFSNACKWRFRWKDGGYKLAEQFCPPRSGKIRTGRAQPADPEVLRWRVDQLVALVGRGRTRTTRDCWSEVCPASKAA